MKIKYNTQVTYKSVNTIITETINKENGINLNALYQRVRSIEIFIMKLFIQTSRSQLALC